MIRPSYFYDLLMKNGTDFFAGVPDSLLKNFCAYVTDNAPAEKHIISANEGSATALATGAAAIPGDATTPIANKLVDVAGYTVIVYVAIILEKYLLTLMGMVAFKFLIPIGMIALVISILLLNDRWKQIVNQLAMKFMVMGILLWILVPVSAWTTNIINETYASVRLSPETIQEVKEDELSAEEQGEEETTEELSKWDQFFSKFTEIADSAKDKVDTNVKKFQNGLNKIIEGVAVMIVTTCVIPIGVLFLFLWIIRTVTGIQISTDVVRSRLLPKKKEENGKRDSDES